MTPQAIRKKFKALSNPKVAEKAAYYFKTSEGDYSEGEKFLGLRVPDIRKIAKDNWEMPMSTIDKFIVSSWHEERLFALIVLNLKYKKADTAEKKKLFNYAVKHKRRIDNWDLVDVSAPHLFGPYVQEFGKFEILKKYSQSKNMWERRIAMISTFAYLRNSSTKETYWVAKKLLNDKEDLIHKAVGWLLREAGKRDMKELLKFIDVHGKKMPRTMLRYAIEKLPEQKRKSILKKTRE